MKFVVVHRYMVDVLKHLNVSNSFKIHSDSVVSVSLVGVFLHLKPFSSWYVNIYVLYRSWNVCTRKSFNLLNNLSSSIILLSSLKPHCCFAWISYFAFLVNLLISHILNAYQKFCKIYQDEGSMVMLRKFLFILSSLTHRFFCVIYHFFQFQLK